MNDKDNSPKNVTKKGRGRPPNAKNKKKDLIEKTSPANVTKKRRGRPSKTIVPNIVENISSIINNAVELHPVTGISKENEILKSLLKESSEPITEPIINKKTKIILRKDNTEQYILDLLSKSGCDKNYQYKPEQFERYNELKKMPANSSNPNKQTLKTELAKLLKVPLDALEHTKKYGIPTTADFVKIILCLENYFKENEVKPSIVPLPTSDEQLPPKEEAVTENTKIENSEDPQKVFDTISKNFTNIFSDKSSKKDDEKLDFEEKKDIEEKIDIEENNGEEKRKIFEDEIDNTQTITPDINIELPEIDNIDKSILEKEQEDLPVPNDIESTNYNTYLFNKEIKEHENIKTNESFQFLYPEINDPDFNIKIEKHKEFNDTKYDGNTSYDFEEHAKKLCNTDFELSPHQLFVKNFLSIQTPYNCLLLYHGLGTGKTCSSIGIAEDMRAYMMQVGLTQPILIIASPNVQQNYRLQLFDERKLKLESGLWKLNTCVGESLIREVNPTNILGIPKDRITSEINSIIDKYYRFMGYIELANYIKRITKMPEGSRFSAAELKELKLKRIRKYFDNRLIVIDEVHNIHISDKNKQEGKTAMLLMDVARYTTSMRLLLLSATPMYNNYNEIIWLTNLINLVNKQSTIRESDIFDKDGKFKDKSDKTDKKIEDGRELLTRKLIGSISYVRGENPYTFPYRIYPDVFSPENSLQTVHENNEYPTKQMNGREIDGKLENIPVFLSEIGEYQAKGYDFIIKHMRNKSTNVVNKFGVEREMPSFENMDVFGYIHLMKPIEALDIVFPSAQLDNLTAKSEEPNEFEDKQNEDLINQYIGKKGLANTMNYTIQKSPYPNIYNFEYKPTILNNVNHGRFFHPDKIGKYSNKIAKICECIKKSKGIVLIFSQYIEGSIIPIALALEEMGINRFCSKSTHAKSLFKTPPTEPIDAITMKPKSQFIQENKASEFNPARYVMITGNGGISPNNLEDIKYVTNTNNINGEKVKVVIISKAGSEGLDFKCIRQIHILDPWYNMSRIEQIIGRGVRNFSHCMLKDFKDRNVEIYLHSTLPRNDEETADLYVYRYAEKKAKQIGEVTRLLKEISVDCLLNIGQHNFTMKQLQTLSESKIIKIRLSSKADELIDYQVGDRDYSELCDYDECPDEFKCSPHSETKEIIKDTYSEDYGKMNYTSIVKRIRDLFKKKIAYTREQLIQEIKIIKEYPEDQIDFALSRFINNKTEYIYDEHGRPGYLINRDQYYAFQPIEITDESSSVFDRSIPVDYKRNLLEIELNKSHHAPATVELVGNEQEYIRKKYNEILIDMNNKFSSIETAKYEKIQQKFNKNTDWYINFGYVYDFLLDKHKIRTDLLNKYIIYHYLDSLSLNDRLFIVRYYYSGEKSVLDSLSNEKYIQNYFNEKIVKVRGMNAIILATDNDNDEVQNKVFIQNDSENSWTWLEADKDDQIIAKKQSANFLYVRLSILNRYFGFMQALKENIVFKILDKNSKIKIGSVCNVEVKKDVIKRINFISNIKYSDSEPDSEINVNSKDIIKPGLCVVLEILLRYYDEIKKDNKRWFLNTEQMPYE